MHIDPKVKSLTIFNSGGGIVEREIKLSVQQGINDFQILNVPASFDPNSADVKLNYLNAEDEKHFNLQQTIVSLPDPKNVQQIIEREKSAANSIISYSIDFTRELREDVSRICEASSYRTYSDMTGIFKFIINATKEGELIVKILYFISDIRIKWDTTLKVSIDDDGNSGEIEGYLVVDNQTGFSYEDVELGFAIFELPSPKSEYRGAIPPPPNVMPEMQQEMLGELNRLKSMKRTQRYKQLL
jgi:hypothetical protein